MTRVREDVAEVAYRPTACQRTYRLILVRQTIQVEEGQTRLFDEIRYRFFLTNDRQSLPRELVFKGNDRCDQENLIAQLKGGVQALRAAVDNLGSNWAYMVMTGLAWSLKAWFALSVPGHPRHKAAHREQKRGLLRMEFKRFVNTRILMPCQIVRGGHRLLYRLLSWNAWQGVFLRVVFALQGRGEAAKEPGSGCPGPRGHREPRGRRGGDDEPVEPVVFQRHSASPMNVRARPGYGDSCGAGLKPRLFKG